VELLYKHLYPILFELFGNAHMLAGYLLLFGQRLQEVIGNVVFPHYKGDSYKFHAAGREDIDVSSSSVILRIF
jgi:hypothetical protein